MNQNKINFKQERDFGELFNATFSFIGDEFKRLGTAILYFVVPLLLLASILGVVIGVRQQEYLSTISTLNDPLSVLRNQFGIYFFLNILLVIVATTSLTCTVLGYVKLYVTKGSDNFTISDVWTEVGKSFFPVLLASVASGVIIIAGLVFCILPGIYLGVSLSLLLPIMVLEDKGFSYAFKRSFKLVKTKFWMTLGALLVMAVLVYIISILFSIPAIVLGMKSLFTSVKDSQIPEFGISFYIISSISSLLTYIISAVPIVLLTFLYYSHVETNESPSLLNRISEIA